MSSGEASGAETSSGDNDSDTQGGDQGGSSTPDMLVSSGASGVPERGGEMSLDAEAGVEGGAMMGGRPDMEVTPLNKSFKRGIASALPNPADLEALSPGISWWYNWSPRYGPQVAETRLSAKVDFLPMTWNGNNPDEIRAFLDAHPEVRYLLTYNEPNFQDQANMTPAYAASLWPTFEQIAEEYDLKLVGPAVNYCGGCVIVDGAPIGSAFTIWLDLFFEEYRAQFGREPRMDFTALHWYDFGLEDQVNEIITRYNKPVWLTEFALWRGEDWCTDEFERDWLIDMVAFLEEHPMVYRYAWFTGRRRDFPKINLLGETGELTPLGEAYINAPY